MSRATNRAAGPARRGTRASPAYWLGVVGIGVAGALVYGWRRRGELDLIAAEGLGYALGIAGLAMMVLLLLYSLRKRWSVLRDAGPSPLWLQIHMMLGLLGPTAILYHANFRLGSLNSRAALFCMLVVSGSGVIGRFLYNRIHYGYLDQRASLAALRQRVEAGSNVLSDAVAVAPGVGEILSDFERAALPGTGTQGQHASGRRPRPGRMRARALRAYREALGSQPDPGAPAPGMLDRALREHGAALRRVRRFAAYERAFALWHAFHLPFCVILFLAAAIHVVAVNMY